MHLDTPVIALGSPDAERARMLYLASFPEEERIPFDMMLVRSDLGMEVRALYDGELFCGFAALRRMKDVVFLMYLAIEPSLRSKGYGSAVLDELCALLPSQSMVLDIEPPSSDAPNAQERVRRKAFYLRNGFRDSWYGYDWRGCSYELLLRGPDLSQQQWQGITLPLRDNVRCVLYRRTPEQNPDC